MKPILQAILLCILLCGLAQAPSVAQLHNPGMLDFNITPFSPGSGANGAILAILPQADGKLIICGDFTEYNGDPRMRMARVDQTGSPDETFEPGTGASDVVFAALIQPDEKIIVAGGFDSFNGAPQSRITRLQADGAIDETFDTGTGANSTIFCSALQADGKIIVGGAFTSFNGVPRHGVARINNDGSIDHSFDPGAESNGLIMTVALQPDGKLFVGGNFTIIQGVPRNGIARLHADGTIDVTFDPGKGAQGNLLNAEIRTLAVQPDGKVVAGGGFTSFNSVPRACIVRLNEDGTVDETFDPAAGANNVVRAISLRPDGKIVVGGDFTSFNEEDRNFIAQLHPDGSLDENFGTGEAAANAPVLATALTSDLRIVIGGMFTTVNEQAYNRIARLNSDGTLHGFNRGSGADSFVEPVVVQSDGKIVFGGTFTSYNGVSRNSIARLNRNGTIDDTFDPGEGADGTIFLILPQPDGKLIIEGDFTKFDGVDRKNIARLNEDGSLDVAFDPGDGSDGIVMTTSVQADGKVVVAGLFTEYNGEQRINVARLNTNGALDESFDPGSGTNGIIFRNPVQPDGKIILSGGFTEYDGTPRNGMVRVNPDGTIDESFDPGEGISGGRIYVLTLLADGRMLIGGSFTSYDGVPRNRIARINPDGSLDETFDPGTGADDVVRAITLQPDGKLIVGGTFTNYNDVPASRVARLHPNGSLDETFHSTSVFNSQVLSAVPHSSGKIVVGGGFGTIDDLPIGGLAFLIGGKKHQTVDFPQPEPVTAGDPSFSLSATASSGLVVSFFSNNPAVASVSGSTLTINAGGTTVITANQQGDANYYAHIGVARLLTVHKLDQTITFDSLPGRAYTEGLSFDVNASSSSGLPVSFSPLSENIEVEGNSVTVLAAGPATVVARQPGNDHYNPAPDVPRIFCVHPPQPAISASEDAEYTVLTSSSASGNKWFLDGSLITGAVDDTYTSNTNGVYTVEVTIGGCTSEMSEPYHILYTGIEDAGDELQLFPNPSRDVLNLILPPGAGDGIMIRIHDLLGMFRKEIITSEHKISIPIDELAAGQYILSIRQKNSVRRALFLKE